MNHEDMFRLHLSGIGKYKGNKLIIDDFTSVEFIDGFNKYIIYEYWFDRPLGTKALGTKAEFSRGERHGRHISYYSTGAIIYTCDYFGGKKHGKYISYYYEGTVRSCYSFTHGVIDEP